MPLRPLRLRCLQKRNYSTSPPSPPAPSASPARWLTTTKARLGKCITFGLTPSQLQSTSRILGILGRDWRELVAGREGFLTDRKRAGVLRRRVVWGEMDSMGHVNNVTYVRYAESARIEWANQFAARSEDAKRREEWRRLWTPEGEGLILRSMRTDYKFPMTWPDHISVFHKLRSLPQADDNSFILDVMILSELHQRPAARCVEDIVVYDYRIARPVALPPFVHKAFAEAFEEQEQARRVNEKKIKEIDDAIRKLELGSWDREDAKEDFGSAGA
ncbi:hypothetical protein PVAG01_04470 [Phlyctema vagabunda]|uniref:Thioesterase/thiol ester dehydrase-isomerase n=1 Tax=Phlyctema vagabunda TaxID=108571 RepID=A0ABR4PPB9_9HELO